MSLSSASLLARQSLIATQQQIALSGRNIAAAGDPTRSRVEGVQVTQGDGSVRIAQIRRAEDSALYAAMVRAVASTAERDAVLSHLTSLSDKVGDPNLGVSPAARIGELEAALVAYANQPDDPLFGRQVVARAKDVATTLNQLASDVNLIREEADAKIDTAVERINELLVLYDDANDDVVRATVRNEDTTLAKDRRDAIVSEINEFLGVTTMQREDGDMALFTDGGITLFDRSARTVEFERTTPYTAATVGGNVVIDGVAVTGTDAPMPSVGGSIVGHARIRDELLPTFRLQLDEMARVLTDTFTDGVGSLFVNGGAPDYAGTLAVAAAVDPAQGGAVENLRDGTGNPSGFAAYSDRLQGLIDAMQATQAVDANAQLGDPVALGNFASGSVSWLEGQRQVVDDEASRERAILENASVALSSATGVNMDDEYARQLEIERSFAASSRLLLIVDEMFNELMRAV